MNDVLQRIKKLGFDSIEEYREFHELSPGADVDAEVLRSLNNTFRFCGHPDHMPVTQGLSHWGKKVLTYAIRGELIGLPLDVVKQSFQTAFDRWSAVCDIRASHIKNVNDAIDIIVNSGKIDGPSGTLAWSQLPGNGSTDPLEQLYDREEKFVIAERVPVGRINLTSVQGHEIGHAVGISHLPGRNWMAAMYDPAISSPQVADIIEGVKRYGQPVQPPTPRPDDTFVYIKIPRSSVFTSLPSS